MNSTGDSWHKLIPDGQPGDVAAGLTCACVLCGGAWRLCACWSLEPWGPLPLPLPAVHMCSHDAAQQLGEAVCPGACRSQAASDLGSGVAAAVQEPWSSAHELPGAVFSRAQAELTSSAAGLSAAASGSDALLGALSPSACLQHAISVSCHGSTLRSSDHNTLCYAWSWRQRAGRLMAGLRTASSRAA